MKKFLKILASAIAGIIVLAAAAVFIVWAPEIKTLGSLEQVGDNKYLYRMEYKAAYDLDDVIAHGIDSNSALLDYVVSKIVRGLPISLTKSEKADTTGFACTSFQARNAEGDGYLFGRNYDFFKNFACNRLKAEERLCIDCSDRPLTPRIRARQATRFVREKALGTCISICAG